MDNKSIVRKVITGLSIVMIIYMIITVVSASSFTVLVADDFSHGNGVGVFHASLSKYFKASVDYAIKEYKEWQGTYFSMFIQALLSPINNFGLIQLKIVMIFNAIFFFSSFLFLIYTILRKIDNDYKYIKLLLAAISLFLITAFDSYTEIFYWFSGAVSYSFPLSVAMIGIASFILLNDTGKGKYFVITIICGICAMGGSLTVAGAGCYAILMLCVYYFFQEKKFERKNITVFIIYFLGALVNAIAPGNFKRHDVIDDSGIHLFKTIYDSVIIGDGRWQFFFKNTDFVFWMFIIAICGFYVNKKTNNKVNWLRFYMSILGLLVSFVTAFPVAMGYSSSEISSRCAFVIDIGIIVSSFNLMINLGSVLSQVTKISKENLKSILCVAAIICFTLDGFGISNVKTFQISLELIDGTYQQYYESCEKFLDRLSKCEKDTDVIIGANEFPQSIENIYSFYLTEDSANWVNTSVAQYYGLKSIAVVN